MPESEEYLLDHILSQVTIVKYTICYHINIPSIIFIELFYCPFRTVSAENLHEGLITTTLHIRAGTGWQGRRRTGKGRLIHGEPPFGRELVPFSENECRGRLLLSVYRAITARFFGGKQRKRLAEKHARKNLTIFLIKL